MARILKQHASWSTQIFKQGPWVLFIFSKTAPVSTFFHRSSSRSPLSFSSLPSSSPATFNAALFHLLHRSQVRRRPPQVLGSLLPHPARSQNGSFTFVPTIFSGQAPQAIYDLMTVGKTIKKVPVVVENCTGFAVNRTFFPYNQAANLLVHLGVDVFRIDRVISNFGMPMGPFQLQDLAGYGVYFAVGKIFASAFKGRTFKSDLFELLVRSGRNGKSNGKGFYIYEKGSKPKPDPNIQAIVEESRRRTNIMPSGKHIILSDQEILEMIFFPIVNEACRVLDERIIVRASDLDVASVLGMGFPGYRGGIVFWADTVGADYIYSRLKKWVQR